MKNIEQQLIQLERQHSELLAELNHVDGDKALHSLIKQAYDIRDRDLQHRPESMDGVAAMAHIARDASDDYESLETHALEKLTSFERPSA